MKNFELSNSLPSHPAKAETALYLQWTFYNHNRLFYTKTNRTIIKTDNTTWEITPRDGLSVELWWWWGTCEWNIFRRETTILYAITAENCCFLSTIIITITIILLLLAVFGYRLDRSFVSVAHLLQLAGLWPIYWGRLCLNENYC